MTTRKQLRDAIGAALADIPTATVFTGRHMSLTDDTPFAISVMVNDGECELDMAGGRTMTATVFVSVTAEGDDDTVDEVAEAIPDLLFDNADLRALVLSVEYRGFEYDRDTIAPPLAAIILTFTMSYHDG